MDILKDLSTITSVPYTNLVQISKKIEDIACHDIKETLDEGGFDTELDFGFGKLVVYINDDKIGYHFIPSNSFEQKLVDLIALGDDALVEALEKSLQEKIINSYKDLF